MKLEDIGYNAHWAMAMQEFEPRGLETGRVMAEHRDRYVVATARGEFEAEVSGNLRFTSQSREDFPAVGDWVAVAVFEPDLAIIHAVLPRQSLIKRKVVGQEGEVQPIAANIDYALIVQAADRDFNLNRTERYLAICYSAQVSPMLVLSKVDLAEGGRLAEITSAIGERIKDVPLLCISSETGEGINRLQEMMEKGKTYCLLGSSGVGKSTLLNTLLGKALMRTDALSASTNKGRHVTSHREIIVLDNGSILIDNPGMREVGLADAAGGLARTFEQIGELAQNCKYPDCTHIHEAGCAVIQAVEQGQIDPGAYENYLKMAREEAHYEASAEERKKKDKMLGKILKDYKKKDYKKRGG
jgi:ribosome biogenesis GTPase